ncbi:MAG TPA: glycosyltransferase family 2 protein [Phycisphaerales bacterium]|nr:glycosyltransferase family 2 protein [Phycisphaerales bacterium]
MTFHAFLLVRNEADILPQTLPHLLEFCGAVHVLDTGSTDGSWDLVREMALREKRLRPFASAPLTGDVSLRGVMFEAVRGTMRDGDWFGRVDADEFYHVPPPEFVDRFVTRREGRVFAQHYDFPMTRSLWEEWNRSPTSPTTVTTPADIRAARRQFIVDTRMWFDARWFRFRRGMRWAPGQPNPFNPGLAARVRIPVLHYRWRNLPQVLDRLSNRAEMAKMDPHGEHWTQADPESWVVADNDPRLLSWSEEVSRHIAGSTNPPDGPPLCNVSPGHIEQAPKRQRQEWLYALGVPRALDVFRKRWDERSVPGSLRTAFRAARG